MVDSDIFTEAAILTTKNEAANQYHYRVELRAHNIFNNIWKSWSKMSFILIRILGIH